MQCKVYNLYIYRTRSIFTVHSLQCCIHSVCAPYRTHCAPVHFLYSFSHSVHTFPTQCCFRALCTLPFFTVHSAHFTVYSLPYMYYVHFIVHFVSFTIQSKAYFHSYFVTPYPPPYHLNLPFF